MYQVLGTKLRNVSTDKDLGVIMASDLTLTKRVEETINKANKVLGLLKCTIGSKNFCISPLFDRSWNMLAWCGHHV